MAGRILALCGGVGGAKLALGFEHLCADGVLDELLIAVNTGDDFEHLGLQICPDLDTVTYTLAGIVNTETGWGRANETGHCLQALRELGGEDWFYLGDRDLAIHLERTRLLQSGWSLSRVSQYFAERLGVKARIIPMSDKPVPTLVHTNDGILSFQHYFVRERCAPVVTSLEYGSEDTPANPVLLELIEGANGNDLTAIVICPSNPYLSVDPLLALVGVRDALAKTKVPVIAVSPIVGGQALKGPTAKIMTELGVEVSNASIAAHYRDFLSCLIIDESDLAEAERVAQYVSRVAPAATVMKSEVDKITLAKRVLTIAREKA